MKTVTFHTGDCLIEVTAWTVFTVYDYLQILLQQCYITQEKFEDIKGLITYSK